MRHTKQFLLITLYEVWRFCFSPHSTIERTLSLSLSLALFIFIFYFCFSIRVCACACVHFAIVSYVRSIQSIDFNTSILSTCKCWIAIIICFVSMIIGPSNKLQSKYSSFDFLILNNYFWKWLSFGIRYIQTAIEMEFLHCCNNFTLTQLTHRLVGCSDDFVWFEVQSRWSGHMIQFLSAPFSYYVCSGSNDLRRDTHTPRVEYAREHKFGFRWNFVFIFFFSSFHCVYVSLIVVRWWFLIHF